MKFNRSSEEIEVNIATICKKRGIPNFYNRFSFEKIFIGSHTLQTYQIAVRQPKGIIIFTPGTNAYALLYGEFLIRLADAGYRVVAYDPRCHGMSTGVNGSYTIPELIDDLLKLTENIVAENSLPLFLAGSSQGGIVSFYAAAEAQKRAEKENQKSMITGIICHNIAELDKPDAVELTRFPFISKLLKKPLTLAAKWFPEFPVSMMLYLNLKIEPVKFMGNAWEIIQHDKLLVDIIRLKTLASLGNTPLPVLIEKVNTPVFILQAGNDTIFKTGYIQRLFQRLNCPKELKIYEGLPHYMIVDYVEVYLDDLVNWLEKR